MGITLFGPVVRVSWRHGGAFFEEPYLLKQISGAELLRWFGGKALSRRYQLFLPVSHHHWFSDLTILPPTPSKLKLKLAPSHVSLCAAAVRRLSLEQKTMVRCGELHCT